MIYQDNLKEIIVTKQELIESCDRLRSEVEVAYQGTEQPVIFLGLLKGCNPFMTDLLRDINLAHVCDYMNVSSYFGQEKAISDVQIIMDMTMNVRDRDVVIVEDIVDSGRTIKKVKELLEFRGAKSIAIVTCLDKPSGRTVELEAEYVGHIVPDAFLVGYGLDYKDEYRNITCVAILDEKAID